MCFRSNNIPKLVSAIIPAYNVESHIGKAVESVLAQTYSPVECIVVDDGSTDDTRERLRPYMNRIHYVWQENQERCVARNTGIAHSQGEFLAFLDADDWWHPTKIEKQIDALLRYPSAGLAYTWMQSVDEDGNFLDSVRDDEDGLLPQGTIFSKLLLGKRLTGAGSTAVVRQSCIEKIGGFDERFPGPEDWEFALRVAMHYDLLCIPELLAYYRCYKGNLMAVMDRRNVQEKHVDIIKKISNMVNGEAVDLSTKKKAFAIAHWRGALIDYGVKNISQALTRAQMAYKESRNYFAEPDPPCLADILGASRFLRYVDGFLDEAGGFIDRVFANLPQELSHLHIYRKKTLTKFYASETFKAYRDNRLYLVREAGFRALWYDPSWLKNLGFMKICLRSWLTLDR